MLTVDGLEVAYGARTALSGVSFAVPDGSLVCLMGPRGSGKTTLLKALMGVVPARAGRVRLDGHDITGLRTPERVRLGLGYAPPGHPAFPHLTVEENLHVARDVGVGRDGAAVDEALDLFPALRAGLRRRAGVLSGGHQQQLGIARALVTRPAMLLLDEPWEGVAPAVVLEIADAVSQLHAAGMTVLVVEEHLDVARRLADAYVVLGGGTVAGAGTRAGLVDDTVRALLAA
jgi:urea transport system ATP-binding protein